MWIFSSEHSMKIKQYNIETGIQNQPSKLFIKVTIVFVSVHARSFCAVVREFLLFKYYPSLVKPYLWLLAKSMNFECKYLNVNIDLVSV